MAGKVAGLLTAGLGTGITSLQSMRLLRLWPRIASFDIAALKLAAMNSCSLTKDCQKQAVRSSRASAKSDWRRISPVSLPLVSGRGEATSPVLLSVPGKPTPLSNTSRNTWVSKVKGVCKHPSAKFRGRVTATYRVKGRGIDGLINFVGTSNGMRGKEGDDLEGREVTGVGEALQNFSNAILGLRDETIDSGGGLIRTTGQEFEAGGALSLYGP